MRDRSATDGGGDEAAGGGDDGAHLVSEHVVPGASATILQISSAFCAPCRAARTVAQRVADTVDGVGHVEVDVASAEGMSWQVRSTPTVLVLDRTGQVRGAVEGVPRLAWLRETASEVAGDAAVGPEISAAVISPDRPSA